MNKAEEFRTLCVLAAWGYACGGAGEVESLVERGLAEFHKDESHEHGFLTAYGIERLQEMAPHHVWTEKSTW